ncbi:PAS domain-containing protein [Acetobacteraceae bacterium H6797]|nr:PAS domain-containing protein [Acetobacteraceae bacterium H6797]
MTRNIPDQIQDYFERSRIALALASAADDNPLLLVNGHFRQLTGYLDEDVIGKNCRMLQRDAENTEARQRINDFLRHEKDTNVRTSIINFRKDGQPFVNLLYMSKLRRADGTVDFIFASQFDVSRSQPELLLRYDQELSETLSRLKPALADNGIMLEGSLLTIANTAALVAQAKITLADLDASPIG